MEDFAAEGLGGDEGDESGISVLDELGVLFLRFTSSSVDLVVNGFELASNMGSVAIEHGGISVLDLTGVVHDDDLRVERSNFFSWVVLGIRSDVSSADILDGDTLDVETNVVTWDGLGEGFVMHFDGLAFSLDLGGSELNEHTGLNDTSFDSADGYCSDTTDLVDVLEGKSEGLLSRSLGGFKSIKGLYEDGSLVPRGVGGLLEHVVSVETRDRDEGDGISLVTDLLEVINKFLLDFVVSFFREVNGLLVHLVEADDHLLNTEGESEKSVLSGLTVLGDTGLELTLRGSNHENSDISLGGTSNHVLDEISVSGSINNGEVILSGFEFPEGDIDGDTSFSLSLKLVENPSVLERSLTGFSRLLLELLNGSFVDTTALVDQVSGSSGLAGIDVSNNDQVNMYFISSCHFS